MGQEAKIRYERTWEMFLQELQTNTTVTLRSVCRKMHTNHCAMGKWLSRHNYSVTKAKVSVLKCRNEKQTAFARLVPKEPKSPLPLNNESSLLGISITFNEVHPKSWTIFSSFDQLFTEDLFILEAL